MRLGVERFCYVIIETKHFSKNTYVHVQIPTRTSNSMVAFEKVGTLEVYQTKSFCKHCYVLEAREPGPQPKARRKRSAQS
jgi:hypothetical protein